jgi:lycopene cyclase domain-containing protein
MPEYTLAAFLFLGGALVLAWRSNVLAELAAWKTLALFGALTVAADLVLTGLPIVTYGRRARSGLAIGPMPIEDLAYGLALCLVAVSAWRRSGTA